MHERIYFLATLTKAYVVTGLEKEKSNMREEQGHRQHFLV